MSVLKSLFLPALILCLGLAPLFCFVMFPGDRSGQGTDDGTTGQTIELATAAAKTARATAEKDASVADHEVWLRFDRPEPLPDVGPNPLFKSLAAQW